MPSDKFIIKSYEIHSTQETSKITRKIDLVSETSKGGIFITASLTSLPKNPWGSKLGMVENYKSQGSDAISITGWIDPEVFNSFYAVLSGESPVTFSFDYTLDPVIPTSAAKQLQSVRLSTGVEQPGDFEKISLSSKLTNIFKENPLPS